MARFGWDLINILAKYGKCEPIVMDEKATESDDVFSDLAQDILHLTCFMNAKYNGRRAARSNTVILPAEAMEAIKDAPGKGGPAGIALVVDDDLTLLGILTDGDVRQLVLDHVDLARPVIDYMKGNPITVEKGLRGADMLHAE